MTGLAGRPKWQGEVTVSSSETWTSEQDLAEAPDRPEFPAVST